MENKIKGSLYGLIWGDVLGCPVETWKEDDIKHIYGDYGNLPTHYPTDKIRTLDARRISRLRPIGLYSDDGQQALALIHTCLSPKGWHQMNWRNMLVNGMSKRAWRGIGGFFTKAVANMQKGIRTDQAGSHSAGIGSAMRIGPLGAIYRDQPDELLKVSLESSLMTHADIRAASFSYAVSFVVASFINGKTVEEITGGLANEVVKAENIILTNYKNWNIDVSGGHQVSKAIRANLSVPVLDMEKTKKALSDFAKPYLADGFSKAHPNQGFVLTGGIHALAVALQKEIHDPNQELLNIIKLGYDTDTVAAIAGTMLGARFGDDWIAKERLLELERIDMYAKSLIELTSPTETMPEFVNKELALTNLEKNFQKKLK